MRVRRADESGALGRVLRRSGRGAVLDVLTGLPGSELTTLLLAAMRVRAGRLGAPEVLRHYQRDRFVAPAQVPHAALRSAEGAALSVLPAGFDVVTPAPVVPMGTHSALGDVDQNNVVSTIRGTEVAADPTNALALEAAARRSAKGTAGRRTAPEVRLAAVQRVLRAQLFDGPASFAHFSLLGLASAGRDTGSLDFERRHATEHLRIASDALRAAVPGCDTEIGLTVLDGRFEAVAAAVRAALPDVAVTDDPHRETGRHYYCGLCFRLTVAAGERRYDVGDGGFVGWTQALLADRKERLLITGVGLERLALLAQQGPG